MLAFLLNMLRGSVFFRGDSVYLERVQKAAVACRQTLADIRRAVVVVAGVTDVTLARSLSHA